MRIPRIYINHSLEVKDTVALSPEAHRHVVSVLRLREGDRIILFNGLGNEFYATITRLEKKISYAHIDTLQENTTQSPLNIELGISLIKNDKFDFAIQKAVELGVSSITPLAAERSTIKLDPKRETKRLLHWRGIIQSACEQSGRAYLPELNPVNSIDGWLRSSDTPGIVFEPESDQTLSTLEIEHSIRIIIGPEGGFTDSELTTIEQCDFYKVKLGPRILRAETAVITALSSLQLLWGDLNI